MFCSKCGYDNPEESEYCISCGNPMTATIVNDDRPSHVQSSYVLPQKSTGLGIVLSFILLGLGHLYTGLVGKGIILIIISIVLWTLSILTLGITAVIYVVLWIWGMYDVNNKINEYNEHLRRVGSPPW